MQGSRRRADQYRARAVQRIDGIYHGSSRDSNGSNAALKSTYHDSDGIIFQCNFAREMIYKHFGPPKRAKCEAVIYNAVDKKKFNPNGERKKFGFKRTIVVSARWQPHKRLSSIMDGFQALRRPDVGMIVLGEVPEEAQFKHPRVKYLGFIPPNELPAYYRAADVMLHLAYVDWCPNTVVEALACGVPVITTHNGGVPELVRNNGIVIKSEPDYDMEFVDFQKLPKVDPDLVASAIDTVIDNKPWFIHEREDVYMDYCVDRYIDFFKTLQETK
jgi:glycosyltransferase involved in cell wall biosynthesis